MSSRHLRFTACSVTALSLFAANAFAAATVNYEGYLYDLDGLPASGGMVIAGTFKPSFNPSNIASVYGDEYGNVGPYYYGLAVADGNILPIGDFVTADSNGYFVGSGATDAAEGTPIYLFGFPAISEYASVLATSTSPTYLVPAMGGTANIDADLADQFIFGQDKPDGIMITLMPIPAPSTALLVCCAFAPLAAARRRRRKPLNHVR